MQILSNNKNIPTIQQKAMSSVACNPCPFVSGSFGLVAKDQSVSSFQTHGLLAQKAKFCKLEVCELEQANLEGNFVFLQLNQNQSIPAPNSTPVIFDNVVSGTLSGYDTTTGIFTAPVSGNYTFTFQLVWEADGAGKSLIIRRGELVLAADAQQYKTLRAETVEYPVVLSVTIFLEQGEVVTNRAQVSNGSVDALATSTVNFVDLHSQLEIVLHEEGV